MKIADVMTRDVRVIAPDHTLRDAARIMDEMNVGVLPVCDGDHLVGILTDRDIVVRSTARGADPARTQVNEVMTDEVDFCFEDEPLEDVIELMSRRQIRRIPVLDRNERLVGIVALGDLATDSEQDATRALRRISEPSEPDRSGTPSSRRADTTRDRAPPRLTPDERGRLEARRRADQDRRGRGERREAGAGGGSGGIGWGFRFRDEDDVRAAVGPFGYPGESGGPPRFMRGGYGGEGYTNYGEEYGRGAHGGGAGRGGYGPGQGYAADLTGRQRRFDYTGDDISAYDRERPEAERALPPAGTRRDRRDYGSGPGHTVFGNDASTGSPGEARGSQPGGGQHRGRGPKGYQRSDERIREDVNDRLTDDPRVDASEIEVTVQGREVTLTGHVGSRQEKRIAEDIAEAVPGVTHVQNNLRVGQQAPPAAPETDTTAPLAAATGNPGTGGAGVGAAGSASGGRATGGQTGHPARGTRRKNATGG